MAAVTFRGHLGFTIALSNMEVIRLCLYGISAFVILFGLLNMVNMLISSAIVRKREFALLQAVGTTNQQLRKMLYREGMSISVKSAILATFLGVAGGDRL